MANFFFFLDSLNTSAFIFRVLLSVLKALVKDSKIETIDNFYVKNITF